MDQDNDIAAQQDARSGGPGARAARKARPSGQRHGVEPSVRRLRIVILGLSITSSWGNGHATTYRALVRELCRRGHDVLFLERDAEWYAHNRDLPASGFGRVELYSSLRELEQRFAAEVRRADFVMVGSYVPEGIAVGAWVQRTAGGPTGFYDIDTPVTLARLGSAGAEYISEALIPRYDVYLSFTGGPTLDTLQTRYRARAALPLYCSVDPGLYFPDQSAPRWALGYMGTYSADRQPGLERLLLEPARALPQQSFAVVGPQYPEHIRWPANVERTAHLSPSAHRTFYNAQRFTLNLTRADMVAAGFSPSVRLFEAAACGTPIISDYWEGLETFFTPGEEILLAHTAQDVRRHLEQTSDERAQAIGERARQRVLGAHTAQHRARELERYVLELLSDSRIARG